MNVSRGEQGYAMVAAVASIAVFAMAAGTIAFFIMVRLLLRYTHPRRTQQCAPPRLHWPPISTAHRAAPLGPAGHDFPFTGEDAPPDLDSVALKIAEHVRCFRFADSVEA